MVVGDAGINRIIVYEKVQAVVGSDVARHVLEVVVMAVESS